MSQRKIYLHLEKVNLIQRDNTPLFETDTHLTKAEYNRLNKDQKRAYKRFIEKMQHR